MKRKKINVVILLMLAIILVLPSGAVSAAARLSEMSGKQIINALKSSGFPICDYEVFTTNRSDPNHLLGKPNQYKCKVDFWDRDYNYDYVDYSGTIEIFKNRSDATRRKKYLSSVYKAVPEWAMRMYQYSNVLLRIDYSVPGKRATYYKKAFADMSKGKRPKFPLSISNKTLSLYVGESSILKLNVNSNKAKWSSTNKSIISVSKTGKIVAKKKGTATVKAKFNGYTVKCKVTVKKPPVKINKSDLTLEIGKTYTLTLLNTKSNAVWSSSNPDIVVVDRKGKVTAKNSGTATITARIGSNKYTCKITVPQKPVRLSGIDISTINWVEDGVDVTFRIKNNTQSKITVYNTAKAYDDDYKLLKIMEMPSSEMITIEPGGQEDIVFLDFSFSNIIYYTQRIDFYFKVGNVKYQCRAEYSYDSNKPYIFSFYKA